MPTGPHPHRTEPTPKASHPSRCRTDETGVVQVIAWKHIRALKRNELLNARLLAVQGTSQREGAACSLVAQQLEA
jgi:hypothetical protein